jgi:alcohol dehydrogenase class IV
VAGPEDLARHVRGFFETLGVNGGLAGQGVPEGDLPALADEATRFRPVLENAPAALDRDDLLAVYRAVMQEG